MRNIKAQPTDNLLPLLLYAALAAAGAFLGNDLRWFNPEFLASIILLSCALLIKPKRFILVGLCFLLFALIGSRLFNLSSQFQIGAVRAVLFSSLVCWGSHSRLRLAPVLMLSALWLFYFYASTFPSLNLEAAKNFQSSFTALGEIFFLLCAYLLLSLPKLKRVVEGPSISFSNFLLHLFLLQAVLLLTIFSYLDISANKGLFNTIISQATPNTNTLGFSFLLFLVLLSFVFSTAARDVLRRLSAALHSEPPSFANQLVETPFEDEAKLISAIQYQTQDLLSYRRAFSEVKQQQDIPLNEINNRWRDLRREAEVISQLPLGYLGVLANGHLVTVSRNLSEILELDSEAKQGDHFSVLERTESPWGLEVSQFIAEVIDRHNPESEDNAPVYYSSSYKEQYLELSAKLARFNHGSVKRASKDVGPGSLLISLSILIRRDQRGLVKDLIRPGGFDRIGAAAAESLHSVETNILQILEQLSVLNTKFHNAVDSSGAVFSSCPAGTTISELILEIEKQTRKLGLNMAQQTENVSGINYGNERLNLSQLLTRTVNLALFNLNSSRTIELQTSVLPLTDSDQEENDTAEIFVEAPASEIYTLSAYLLYTLQYLLPVARDAQFSLEREIIGTGTASLITGSPPGNYARLTIEHSGQSITPNIFSAQQETTFSLRKDVMDTLGYALYFLSRQVKRLNGFVSIQSSVVKGTNISIYVPLKFSVSNKGFREGMRKLYSRLRAEGGEHTQRQVMLVSKDEQLIALLSEVLASLSCNLILRQAEEVIRELINPLEFSGFGFQETSEENANIKDLHFEQTTAELQEFEPFKAPLSAESNSEQTQDVTNNVRLLILDAASGEFETLSVADELEKSFPYAEKVLVLNSEDRERLADLSGWRFIFKPLEENSLREHLAAVLSKASTANENVLLVSGSELT